MSFSISQTAEIRSVNISKGKQDESPVCVTIGLTFPNVKTDAVCAALGCREQDLAGWFSKDGDALFSGMNHIDTWAEWKDQHELTMLGFTCEVAKVSKVLVTPRGNRSFEVQCNVQIQDPKEHTIEKIAGNLHHDVKVTLDHQAVLPLAEQEEAA